MTALALIGQGRLFRTGTYLMHTQDINTQSTPARFHNVAASPARLTHEFAEDGRLLLGHVGRELPQASRLRRSSRLIVDGVYSFR